MYEVSWARSNGFNWALLKTSLLCDVDQMSLTLLFILGNKRKLIQHLSTGRPNMFSKLNSSMSNSVVQRSMLSTIIRGLILGRSFKNFLISLFFWRISYITVCTVIGKETLEKFLLMWKKKTWLNLKRSVTVLGPVVQRADNAIHRINRYPGDKW